MRANIGITETNKQAVASELSKIVADETVVYIKTKNGHWNIEGNDFIDKHLFFQAQLVQLDEIIDRVAERIRALGHYAPGTLNSYLNLTHRTETKKFKNDSQGFIKELLEDHESIIIAMRGTIKQFADDFYDYGSSGLLIGILQQHEKMAWFLRSHLKN